MRVSAIPGLLFLLAGCQKWPDDGVAHVKDLFARGAVGLDCLNSAWMMARDRHTPSHWRDANLCTFKQGEIRFTMWNKKVNGTARCQVGDSIGEYSITVYQERKAANYWGGYFCSNASGRELSSLPLGSVTEKEGALY